MENYKNQMEQILELAKEIGFDAKNATKKDWDSLVLKWFKSTYEFSIKLDKMTTEEKKVYFGF